MKSCTVEHLEAPQAQIMRLTNDALAGVLGELSDWSNMSKKLALVKLRETPTNPQNIEDLKEIPKKHGKPCKGILSYCTIRLRMKNMSRKIFSARENV